MQESQSFPCWFVSHQAQFAPWCCHAGKLLLLMLRCANRYQPPRQACTQIRSLCRLILGALLGIPLQGQQASLWWITSILRVRSSAVWPRKPATCCFCRGRTWSFHPQCQRRKSPRRWSNQRCATEGPVAPFGHRRVAGYRHRHCHSRSTWSIPCCWPFQAATCRKDIHSTLRSWEHVGLQEEEVEKEVANFAGFCLGSLHKRAKGLSASDLALACILRRVLS